MTGDSDLVDRIIEDYHSAGLSEKTQAVLDYSCKLTREPGLVDEGDVERLKEMGYSDRAILDICQVTAYFNFVNRMADGLGVELERS